MRFKKSIAAASIVSAIGVGVYQLNPETHDTVWIHGSFHVLHDVKRAAMVDAHVSMALYCTADTADMLDSKPSDIAISMRADSAVACDYTSNRIPAIAVVGFDNTMGRDVGDERVENALVINTVNHGRAIDYHVDTQNLSDAMPLFANMLLRINAARREVRLTEYGLDGIRRVLDASSDEDYFIDDQYAGQVIDIERAVEIALHPETMASAIFLPSIYSILLSDE